MSLHEVPRLKGGEKEGTGAPYRRKMISQYMYPNKVLLSKINKDLLKTNSKKTEIWWVKVSADS